MQRLINTLFAATKSGYLNLDTLKCWADRCIEEIEQPIYLLIELSTAANTKDVLNILLTALPESGGICNEYYGELLIGFLYLQLKKDGGDLDKFATECIGIMDVYCVQGGPTGTEFINGALAEEFVESLVVLAKESEANLERVLEMRFDADENKALKKAN